MTDNNINVTVLHQLLHVQQQQPEDEQAVTALMRRRRIRARGARQRRCWVIPWVGDVRRDQFGHYNQLMVELRREDPASFQNFLRIQPHMFDEPLARVGRRITKQDTNYRKALDPGTKLAATRRHLASEAGHQLQKGLGPRDEAGHQLQKGLGPRDEAGCNSSPPSLWRHIREHEVRFPDHSKHAICAGQRSLPGHRRRVQR